MLEQFKFPCVPVSILAGKVLAWLEVLLGLHEQLFRLFRTNPTMRSTNTVHVALAIAAAVTRECDFLWWLLFCREEYPKEGFGDFGLCFGFCLAAGEGGGGGGD